MTQDNLSAQNIAQAPHTALGIPGLLHACLIGQGGFGTVYRAYQPELDRNVAVKVLTPHHSADKAVEWFARERRVLAALQEHPNIINVIDAGETPSGQPYFLMPLLTGGSLADVIAKRGALPWKNTLSIGTQLAGALTASHALNVLHRDIKPANVLFSCFGQPHLADFGIARFHNQGETTHNLPKTIAYAAPEIIADESASPASDIYSLAATLYTALCGRPPYEQATEETPFSLMRRIAIESPRLLPKETPKSLANVLHQAMAKNPADRHTSAEAFHEALRQVQEHEGVWATDFLPQQKEAGEILLADLSDLSPDLSTNLPTLSTRETPFLDTDLPTGPPDLPTGPDQTSAKDLVSQTNFSSTNLPWPEEVRNTDSTLLSLNYPALTKKTLQASHPQKTLHDQESLQQIGETSAHPGDHSDSLIGFPRRSLLHALKTAGGASILGTFFLLRTEKKRSTVFSANSAKTSNVLSVINVNEHLPTASVTTSRPLGGPVRTALGAGDLWVTNYKESTVHRLDPVSLQIKTSIPVGEGPVGVVAGRGHIWVASHDDDSVTQIDPRTNRTVGRIELTDGDGPHELIMAFDALWTVNQTPDSDISTVVRIDLYDFQETARLRIGGNALSITAGEGAIWAASMLRKRVYRIDPNEAKITGETELAGPPRSIAYGNKALWALDTTGAVHRLLSAARKKDRTTQLHIDTTIPLPSSPFATAYAHGWLWVTLGETGQLIAIDTTILTPTKARNIGPKPRGVSAVDGVVWVALREETVARVDLSG